MFDRNKFREPDPVNTPAYFWLWNAPLKKEKLFAQLEDMAAAGAKNVCIHPLPPEFRTNQMTTMTPAYLSDEFFRIYADVTGKCASLGMTSYLYDEGGWPSGGACGQVVAADPARFRRHILELSPEGEVVKTALPFNPYAADMPDNMVPEATEKFFDLTHRAYKKYVGHHFGSTIRFAFTDEPQLGACISGKLPWTEGIEDEFIKRKDYDIRPCLKDILANPGMTPADTAKQRLDYYEVYSQLFVERYLEPLQKCCHDCGLLSAGHFSGEDEWFTPGLLTFGSILPSLRALDVPGVDVIWRQIAPGSRLHPFPKLAASAARQTGAKYTLAEIMAIYGNSITPSDTRFVADYMFVCGINLFVLAYYPYETSGGNIEGCRPHSGKVDPLWDFMAPLHAHLSRLSAVGTESSPEVSTALYFDQRSLWTGGRKTEYSAVNQLSIAEKLLNALCDFDYIDDLVIAEGTAENGKLRFREALYDRIILPANPSLSREAEKNLENLRKQGICILSADETEKVPALLKTSAPSGKFRVRKMCSGSDTFYFIMNITAQAVTADFTAEEKLPVYLCNTENGTFHAIKDSAAGSWRHTFAPYSSALFLASSSEDLIQPPLPRAGKLLAELDENWEIAPVKQVYVGNSDYEIKEMEPVFRPCTTGDWKELLGSDFSGKAVYRKKFNWQGDTSDLLFSAGKVKCCAEVKLNGISLGMIIYPSTFLELEGALKEGENLLEITVANKLANAIVKEGVLEKWCRDLPYMTYYEIQQRDYEKEDTASGLFGPVRIFQADK